MTPSDTWFSSFALEWARDVEHWISPERVAPYKVEGGPEVRRGEYDTVVNTYDEDDPCLKTSKLMSSFWVFVVIRVS